MCAKHLSPVCPGFSLLHNMQLYIDLCTRGFRDGSRTYVHTYIRAFYLDGDIGEVSLDQSLVERESPRRREYSEEDMKTWRLWKCKNFTDPLVEERRNDERRGNRMGGRRQTNSRE